MKATYKTKNRGASMVVLEKPNYYEVISFHAKSEEDCREVLRELVVDSFAYKAFVRIGSKTVQQIQFNAYNVVSILKSLGFEYNPSSAMYVFDGRDNSIKNKVYAVTPMKMDTLTDIYHAVVNKTKADSWAAKNVFGDILAYYPTEEEALRHR